MLIARVNSSRNAEYQVFEDTAINYFFRPENLIKRPVENSKKKGVLYPLPAGYVCRTGKNPNV